MITLQNRVAFTVALGVTAVVVSCQSLPDTALKARGGQAGANATGGVGGAAPSGGAGNGSGGMTAGAGKSTASGAGKGSAGAGAGGSSGTGGGGTSGGSAGRGGKGQSAGAGGTGNIETGGASDAGATSGSSGGTSSTNRDDFFGDSRCAGSSFPLCEDFESGTLDTGTWTPRGAAPKIETTRAARGTHSAHFHTTDNGLQYITQTKTFPAPNNTYYARVFVWFDALPTAPDWAHWTISGAQDAAAGDSAPEIRIGGQWNTNDSIELFGVGTDRGDTGDWTNLDADPSGKPKAVPAQDWVCVEWMFDGTNNQTKFWWDGVEHPSLATSSTNHGGSSDPFLLPTFGSMWIGWWLYQAGTTPPQFDTWFDEVAVDYERIGCNR